VTDPHAPGHAGRLLIFDDDDGVAETIGAIAAGLGFTYRAAREPAAFFRFLDDWRPTHIALDLVMPTLDGIEALRLLGQRRCRALILITSGMDERTLAAAQRAGTEHGLRVLGALPKPFAASVLKALLVKDWTGAADVAAPAVPPPRGAARPAEPEPVTEAALADGLERREITVHFQPTVHCASGELAGFETLARWPRPDGTTVPPDRFIPIAEQSGLIDSLTDQVVDQGLAWLAATFSRLAPRLAINLSTRSLRQADLADRFAARCERFGIPPSQVVFEVTETSAMRGDHAELALLTRFRLRGFNLSIDDFGVGYSSLVQLARLPFSGLKIDKMFVTSVPQSKESRSIVRGIVGLAHGLGIRVTAEGVEDEWTLSFLRDVGCDLAQGYHISKPMDAATAIAWAAARPGNAAGL
jgi:EAL domain-containing protein (putative c-di-GMP-specific phosphodiesterase class I)/ActR/RegA family two-component response regulator